MIGLVSSIEKNGRYGFIKYGTNKQIFFPYSRVAPITRNYLSLELRVSFDIEESRGRYMATNVEMITED